MLFSAIYYLAGGTDQDGNPYIYSVLDWRDPGAAILTIFESIVGFAVVYPILYSFYRLRKFIYDECTPWGTAKSEHLAFWTNSTKRSWTKSIKEKNGNDNMAYEMD